MMRISAIVEGHGEVRAVPILLRRLMTWRPVNEPVEILPPIRVPRDRFLNKPEEFHRYLQLARQKAGPDGWILVLLDADDDCPATKAAEVLARARKNVPAGRLLVVLANREFEAWYIGAGRSLNGFRGLALAEADLSIDAEGPRDAKGWLVLRMSGRRYGETTDQPAFASRMDPAEAHLRCRSFRKLCDEWDRQTLPARSDAPPDAPLFPDFERILHS